jgi:hypothetical protein
MNDWLHNLPVAVDGPSSLWRYVPELDTIPAVKLRELVRRATSGTSTRGKLKLLRIAGAHKHSRRCAPDLRYKRYRSRWRATSWRYRKDVWWRNYRRFTLSYGEAIMTVQFSRQTIAALSANLPMTGSGLVRRLVRARNDPGKERVRMCLLHLDDAQLQSGLGLTVEDIAVLRGGTLRNPHAF